MLVFFCLFVFFLTLQKLNPILYARTNTIDQQQIELGVKPLSIAFTVL